MSSKLEEICSNQDKASIIQGHFITQTGHISTRNNKSDTGHIMVKLRTPHIPFYGTPHVVFIRHLMPPPPPPKKKKKKKIRTPHVLFPGTHYVPKAEHIVSKLRHIMSFALGHIMSLNPGHIMTNTG